VNVPMTPLQGSSASGSEHVQQKVQVRLLKKALESQKDQTRQLMNMTESKGRLVDVRA
jgi:hypothetical protein